VTDARRRLAVLGSPIEHSLSPVLHRTAYEHLGLPYDYDRVEVASGGLADFVGGLDASWRGLSLTMPLKREVLPLLDRTTPLVDELGVANTMAFRTVGGRVERWGANTDVDGLVRPVAALGHVPGEATVLGGGATALSAMAAAWNLGARSFSIHLRNPMRAGELTSLAAELGADVMVAPLTELPSLGPLDFVISTLPGGAADDLHLRPTSNSSVLFDVAYEPWPTRLASRWSADGGIVFNGLDMLVEQALGQVRLFSGRAQDEPVPDEDVVRDAMRDSVGSPIRGRSTTDSVAG
jgi:shikimate dehydrogenase